MENFTWSFEEVFSRVLWKVFPKFLQEYIQHCAKNMSKKSSPNIFLKWFLQIVREISLQSLLYIHDMNEKLKALGWNVIMWNAFMCFCIFVNYKFRMLIFKKKFIFTFFIKPFVWKYSAILGQWRLWFIEFSSSLFSKSSKDTLKNSKRRFRAIEEIRYGIFP